MLWTCPLFYLTLFCAGVSLDIILEPETKTLTVLVGEPATFRCNVTGGDLKNYQVSWYRKNEDNSLTLIYRQSNNTNDNLRSNFKGNTDASKSQCILDIEKATTANAGTYYCAADIHSTPGLLLVASEPLGLAELAEPMRDHLWLKCVPYPR
uniref:Ig-like domain-containing protein n=1 Tax=Canis lupus familiaris TaxID=9615 RepID=A0A8I3MEB8_CANLF